MWLSALARVAHAGMEGMGFGKETATHFQAPCQLDSMLVLKHFSQKCRQQVHHSCTSLDADVLAASAVSMLGTVPGL
jgi:hypothetical protein